MAALAQRSASSTALLLDTRGSPARDKKRSLAN
jgi:hypothetical protein